MHVALVRGSIRASMLCSGRIMNSAASTLQAILNPRSIAVAGNPATTSPAPAWTIVALITIGLFVDQHVPVWGQHAVSIVTWAMLLYWLAHSTPDTRTSMILCVAYATAGEIFLSLGWGLYEYRLNNIPLFVPGPSANACPSQSLGRCRWLQHRRCSYWRGSAPTPWA